MKKIAEKDSERKKLAEQLSTILNNPHTPEAIYESLADLITFYTNFLDYNSAELIEMALKAYDERGNGQIPDIASTGEMSVIVGGVQ